ncbi:MAG: hypothetical protein ACKV2Q_21150 [Planctomycetaceae bacterium]
MIAVLTGFIPTHASRVRHTHFRTNWETQSAAADLARDEGIFTEPALAGALRAARERRLAPDAHIICMITGSGFKDPHSVEEAVAATARAPLVSLEEFTNLGS